jgi:hypothetical protein
MHSGILCWDWRHISLSIQRHASAPAVCDNVDHNRHVAVGWYSFVRARTFADVLTDGTCAQANAVQIVDSRLTETQEFCRHVHVLRCRSH